MNTAPPSLSATTPLQALWHWLMAAPRESEPSTSNVFEQVTPNFRCASTSRALGLRAQPLASDHTIVRRPLRVVRVMEAGQIPSQAGRMVISGHMADVCAELERLAEHEARVH